MTYPLGDDDDLLQCIDEFDVALEQLARQLARAVIADELAQRRRAQPRAAARAPRAIAPREPIAPPRAQAIEPAPAAPGKRTKWTREAVIAELCEWLISGIVEPAFLRRHGKPGLVTAATRIFGRFDSALNVANLYLAKQYPDGPPAKRRPPISTAPARQRADSSPPPAEPDAAPIAPEPAASSEPVDAEPAPDRSHVN